MSTKQTIPIAVPPGSAPVALGHLNILHGTYFRPSELAATERSAAMLREGSIVPVWSGPVAPVDFAVQFIEQRAADYVRDYASTEHDTDALVFITGEAGREYHSTLTELADDLRTAVAAAFAVPLDLLDGQRRVPRLPTPKQLREAMRAMPVPDAELAKAIYLAMTSPEALKEEVLAPRVPSAESKS